MSNQEHTPEPWRVDAERPTQVILSDKVYDEFCTWSHPFHQEKQQAEANAARIVACVNAFAHIEDPVTWLPKMRHNISAMSDEIQRQNRLNNELKAERDELLLTIKRLSQTFLKGKTAKEITDWLRSECNQVLDKTKGG
ncbi:MAG: hypothetical protein C0424_10520 [Sphingobacteriaceae bacterium]|nr:hypothetical protein [Sphingobacteriaceae bacterium]